MSYPTFNDLMEWPADWDRDCLNCIGKGFTLSSTASAGSASGDYGQTVVSVGHEIQPGGTALWSLPITTLLPGEISIKYYATGRDDAALGAVRLDVDIRARNVSFPNPPSVSHSVRGGSPRGDGQTPTAPASATAPLLSQSVELTQRTGVAVARWAALLPFAGPLWLTFKFRNLDSARDTKATVTIVSLSVQHEASGGGSRCVPCPVGFACDSFAAQPTPCGPGTTSTDAHQVCSACPPGFVSNVRNNEVCVPCSPGFTSNEARTGCLISQLDQAIPHFVAWTTHLWTPPAPKPVATLPSTIVSIPATTVNGNLAPIRRVLSPLGINQFTVFNFSYFHGRVLPISLKSGRFSVGESTLYLSLIEPRVAVSPCRESELDPYVTTYGCLATSSGAYVRLGNYLSFGKLQKGNDTVGVSFSYATTEACNEDVTRQLTLTVELSCDPSVANHEIASVQTRKCEVLVELRSRYGCMLCGNQSAVVAETSCDSTGHKDRLYNWADWQGHALTSPQCVQPTWRPGVLLDSVVERVLAQYGVNLTGLPPSERLECPWLTMELPGHVTATWVLLASVILLLLILIAMSIYLYYARNRLYREYTTLKNAAPVEMGGRSGEDVIEIDDDMNDPLPQVVARPHQAPPPPPPRSASRSAEPHGGDPA